MPIPPLSTPFPNVRLVDSAGNVSLPWRTFLLALWRRTGTVPGVDSGAAATHLAAETAARQAQDEMLVVAIAAEAALREAADSLETARRVAGDNASLDSHATSWAYQDWSWLPRSDPGGGRPWIDNGHLMVTVPGTAWLLEDGTGSWRLEDDSGNWGHG